MIYEHNISDLAPQRQEMTIETVTSGPFAQGIKRRQNMTNSGSLPPRQNVVPTAEKTDFYTSRVGILLFSPLFENITIQPRVNANENTMNSIRMHHFKKMNYQSFLYTVQEIGDLPTATLIISDLYSFSTTKSLVTE
ncbi:hypothetical protein Tco_0494062 [Tanacetum coccineum]